jgi:mono/diheme cytochrome c family protein
VTAGSNGRAMRPSILATRRAKLLPHESALRTGKALWAAAAFIGLALALFSSARAAVAQAPADKLAPLGAELFRAKGCVACHGTGGLPLDAIATYSDDDVFEVFASPPAGMPVLELTTEERKALLAYLRTRIAGPKAPREE